MSLAVINSVWIGPTLGRVHAACLRSFLRHGHRVVLHSYQRPSDVPSGVEVADAGELLPASRIIRYSRGGSLAIFANLLRYEMLRKGLGLYVDCDCYCVRPVDDADYIFGYESNSYINCAVLKLPPDSDVTRQLCSLKDMRGFIPPWAGTKRKAYYRLRAALGVPAKIQDMPWGYTGPRAVTWYLKQQKLDRLAASIDVFYPIHMDQTPLLLDPDLRLADISTPRTKVLHLWNERLKHVDISAIADTSPLGVMLSSA